MKYKIAIIHQKHIISQLEVLLEGKPTAYFKRFEASLREEKNQLFSGMCILNNRSREFNENQELLEKAMMQKKMHDGKVLMDKIQNLPARCSSYQFMDSLVNMFKVDVRQVAQNFVFRLNDQLKFDFIIIFMLLNNPEKLTQINILVKQLFEIQQNELKVEVQDSLKVVELGDIEIFQTPRQKYYFCIELVGVSLQDSLVKYYKLLEKKLSQQQRSLL